MDKSIFWQGEKTDSFPAVHLLADAFMAPSDTTLLPGRASESAAREYGQPSPARKEFNETFAKFQDLQALLSPEGAFSQTRDDFLSSIKAADNSTEETEALFYNELSASARGSFGPYPKAIEKLQVVSAKLTGLPPAERHALMRELADGKNTVLDNYPELKEALDQVPDDFAARSKAELLRSWFDYRAAIGDSIGQRQVYVGLADRFGNKDEARSQELKVQEYKNRIGGRFVFD